MTMKEYNHNYMAIPRFSRELSASTSTTFRATDFKDSYGNVDNWYGFMIAEDGTQIGLVEYNGYSVDYSGRVFDNNVTKLGNIKSIEIISGKVDIQVN